MWTTTWKPATAQEKKDRQLHCSQPFFSHLDFFLIATVSCHSCGWIAAVEFPTWNATKTPTEQVIFIFVTIPWRRSLTQLLHTACYFAAAFPT